jgi:acyl-coenzyme A thioesterase PaaI-like protein
MARLSITHAMDSHPAARTAEQTAMALADRAAYYLALALGEHPDAVTASLAIQLVAPVPAGPLVATATLLHRERGRMVCIVELRAGADATSGPLVAHATVSYALPRTVTAS